jgi:hypothetical protein
VQASASSPAVLIFKLTGGAFGDWVGAAACIGEAQARVKQKTRMNRIEHVLRLIIPHNACPASGPFGREPFSSHGPPVNSLIACLKEVWMESIGQRKQEPIPPKQLDTMECRR